MLLAGAVLHGAVNAGTPVALAAVGEVVAERSGVMNLGVEGMMAAGALAGFAATLATGSPAVGFLAAAGAGAALAAVHAFATVTLHANQVAAGLALAMLGAGLASYLGEGYSREVVPGVPGAPVPLLSRIPILGSGLFDHAPPVYATAFAVAGAWFFLRRTRPGLRLQVVGEAPATADSLGIGVPLFRYGAVIAGGALAGAGGAYISLVISPSWSDGATTGKGWVAVAMVVLGGWGPVRAALGALLLSGMTSLQLRLQASGVSLPPSLLEATPYLVTIALLVVYSSSKLRRRYGAPAALGLPYHREGSPG
ncbi:MAG: ABC transporter permease [Planctomycetes bacterium]|nr:ABC transporter permease [Planctomycetota bacterium]